MRTHTFRRDRARQLVIRSDELKESLEQVVTDFRKWIVDVGDKIGDYDYEPHIISQHTDVARWSRWLATFAHALGLGIALGWSFEQGGESSWVAAISGGLLYGLFAYAGNLGLSSRYPGAAFINRFQYLFLPPFTLAVVAGAAILLERFAGPELAKTLLRWDAWAWMALESSALMIGCVATVALERYGRSSRQYQRYVDLRRDIANLHDQLDTLGGDGQSVVDAHGATPRQPSPAPADTTSAPVMPPPASARQEDDVPLAAVSPPTGGTHNRSTPNGTRRALLGLALLPLLGTPAWAQSAQPLTAVPCGPTILLDRTGSFVDQGDIEDELVVSISEALSSAMTGRSAHIECIRLVLFSSDAFAAKVHKITVETPAGKVFRSLRDAAVQVAVRDTAQRVREVLAPAAIQSPATRSCVPDMIKRTVSEGTALLITDADHDGCGPLHPKQINGDDEATVIVVVARSKRDKGPSGDVFDARARIVTKFVPAATVLPAYELKKAVNLLFDRHAHSRSAD